MTIQVRYEKLSEEGEEKVQKKYNWLWIIGFILFTSLITVPLIVNVLYHKNVNGSHENSTIVNETLSNICQTNECKDAANNILKNMNMNADPCEDFYEFTCGNYLKEKKIPEDEEDISTFTELKSNLSTRVANELEKEIQESDIEAIRKAKQLYASCMNDDKTIAQSDDHWLKQVLNKQLYGWPLLTAGSLPNNYISPVEKLVKLRLFGAHPIYSVNVITNPNERRTKMLSISQSTLYFISKNDSEIEAYKETITNLAHDLGAFTFNGDNFKSEIDEMNEMEMKFSQLVIKSTKFDYENTTIRDLDRRLPGFELKKFIVDGIYSVLYPEFNVSEDENILVYDMKYLDRAHELFINETRERPKTLHNLITWLFLKEYTEINRQKEHFRYDSVSSAQMTTQSKLVWCVDILESTMPAAVARVYYDKYYNNKTKHEISEIVDNIRVELAQIIRQADWMDEESRAKALDKALSMKVNITYPDYIKNDTHLNKLYAKYNFDSSNSKMNLLHAIQIKEKEKFKVLREKEYQDESQFNPIEPNAFYNVFLNEIFILDGILHPPFYIVEGPKYLNYGGIGFVIGHEITHGFDNQGRHFDKNGNNFPDGNAGLWTQKTIDEYKKRAQCIINQYNSYNITQVNMKLNGIKTEGENIADNGGLRESFRAYKQWEKKNGKEKLLPGLDFNQDQLFFINYGQMMCEKFKDETLRLLILFGEDHSPGRFRVIGSTSNYDEFAKAFKCKANTPNNPDKKCIVW